MNIFTVITLAIVLEVAELVFYMFILKKYKEKSITIRQVIINFLVIFVIISLLSGFYIVTTNKGYVYRGFSGEAKIITNTGIKYAFPFITTIEGYDLRGTYMTYTTNSFPLNLPTKDNQVVLVAGTIFYKISNLKDYAVNNLNTNEQIYNYFISLINNEVKSNTKDNLINNRAIIEKTIMDEMNVFGESRGIKVDNFKFTTLAETQDVVNANNYQASTSIKSLADRNANELLQSSLDKYTSDELDYLKTKILSDNKDIKWVLSTTGGGGLIVNENSKS